MQINLSNFIKNKALELGFNKVGITSAEPLEKEGQLLRKWLDNGFSASMAWMKTRLKERENIFNYYPEAKSVVSVAINYFHGLSEGELKISNYAWGDDYHDVVKKRLHKLLSAIQQKDPGINGLVCVDTSPVMEKAWAQKGGLGWQGKHTNLITRDFGSWIFLGELILDSELQYDRPFEDDLCGSCTACIDACPTDALVDEYVVDSNRCISYLTIEHRDNIPEELGNRFNGWIYGCDICQQVCPWNKKFAQISVEESFLPRHDIMNKSKAEWEKITEEEFLRIMRKSSIKRTKFKGLMRNILLNS